MRVFLLFLFCVATNCFGAQVLSGVETLPHDLQNGNACIIYVHNYSGYGVEVAMNSSRKYYILPDHDYELYLPQYYNGYIFHDASGNSLGLRDYIGSDVNPDKPWVRHIWVVQNPATDAAEFWGLSAVNIPSPYDHFTTGILLGVVVALSIAGLRVWRRSVSVSLGG